MGSGSIVNEVQSVYDDFGELVTEYQEHGGAVDTGTSLKVEYAYADGSSNTIRLTKMTYPDGRELNYDYGSSGSTDDALSRVASLIDDDGSTHLVDYSYLGRNTFVQTDYPEPDLRYDLAMGAGDDPYDGLDRFGRIVDSRWYDYGSSADADRILYGYDRASNRTYREQTCDSNSYHDEVYGYDSVNRLTDFDRGTINANKDAISTLKFAQQWSLDPTGNWSAFKEDDDGDSSWDLEQTRTSNAVNEITDVTETSGPAWATPVYNRAGNMTTIPKPADPTSSFTATYDAWNRLIKLEEGANTVAEYVYDGAKRRVIQKSYTSGTLSETRRFCHSRQWQVIEERVSAIVDMQFVWGLRYIDEIVLRDRDGDSDAVMDERRYALQDANWNVTALADNNGDVQERYAYTAYGKRQVLSPTFATASSSECNWQIQFAGYRYDAPTGLYHVRHRMYQPELGCWVQRDPAGEAKSQDLYGYAYCQPPSQLDPSGLWVWDARIDSSDLGNPLSLDRRDTFTIFVNDTAIPDRPAPTQFWAINHLQWWWIDRECQYHGPRERFLIDVFPIAKLRRDKKTDTWLTFDADMHAVIDIGGAKATSHCLTVLTGKKLLGFNALENGRNVGLPVGTYFLDYFTERQQIQLTNIRPLGPLVDYHFLFVKANCVCCMPERLIQGLPDAVRTVLMTFWEAIPESLECVVYPDLKYANCVST